ncbi:hypothetical protein BN2475_530006 [Paraburkholderia ribeironis]|uniref:Uncharacterized protein n=1 Tax=Paraburkholderia ribeironis TaxID=1247936 RepID=A0A1N7SCI9_9BURK|nr:hypothetical protein BN2475_530006 [Paraburkholderia ribeironis]
MLFSSAHNAPPGPKVRLFGKFCRWMSGLIPLEPVSRQAPRDGKVSFFGGVRWAMRHSFVKCTASAVWTTAAQVVSAQATRAIAAKLARLCPTYLDMSANRGGVRAWGTRAGNARRRRPGDRADARSA